MPVTRTTLAIIPLLLAAMGNVSAETLTLPVDNGRAMQPQEQAISIALPAKGMSMEQVERQFGSPHQRLSPVGKPRITRWVYEDYTAYFEGRYIIHSVLHP